jgi:putative DNA primase/helicase
MTPQTPITPELIRSALAYIPANLPRDEWARVGMAIKSEFPDGTGFDLFDAWSASDPDRYDRKAVQSTWRSIKAGGRVGVATLLHLAKEHGFTLPKPDQAPAAPTAAELAERERQRVERQRQEQARIEAAQAAAAEQAAVQWAEASETGASPYAVRKGVQAHGLRFAVGGWLLVPLRDAAGKLWNLQRIAPAKPENGAPEKLFLKGGRKSGLWHLVGDLASGGDTGPDTSGPAVLLIAEGYATAATVHEATGYPVAVAFDAGNLQHVARALRQQYPAALLVLCGDDDQDTEKQTGTNPGRIKATAAARAVRGLAVFPEGLPPGGSDFNDLAAHQGAGAGLEAVRRIVSGAIEAHTAAQAGAQQAKGTRARGQAGQHQKNGASGPPASPPGAQPGGPADPGDKPAPDAGRDWDRFTVTDAGVFFNGVDKEGQPTKPVWVCSRLDVEALTRDQDGQGWGYLLTFADPLGRRKQWAMPARMLATDGGEYRGALLGLGLRIATSPAARNLLTQYIQTRDPGEYATCTDRVGWHQSGDRQVFVLPHETIGDDAERVVFQTESGQENTFRVKGTAEQWRQRVAALCVGNSRLAFAVASAFAGPLLRPAGVESGGFHFRGDSSSGKTTALKVAASVYGGPSYLQRWRTTDNALEAIAAQHCDGLLILDELAQVDPKTAGECAYMLANEQSKARATRTGTPRARLSWRLLFLSAGELGLADHMAEGMKRARTGQEVRMADIPADAGAGMGAFENLHGREGGADFARHLTGQAGTVYGAAGRAWLQWLTENADGLKARIRDAVGILARQIVPEAASGQVERVGARFALVGAAGELATAAGLTGWPVGESERAARECFNAWLAARGGIGNGEVSAMLRQVRRFLEAHGEGRFTWWHRAADDHSAKTLNRAGLRRMLNEHGEPIKTNSQHLVEYGEKMPAALGEHVTVEYFVLSEVFKAEICQGFDPQAVARVLADHGCLVTTEPGRYSVKHRLPGLGSARCYRISATIHDLEV